MKKEQHTYLGLRPVFIKHFLRGSVKCLPYLGNLLDEIIFGVLDDESAKTESKKIHKKLDEIIEGQDQQGADFAEILLALHIQTDVNETIKERLKEIEQSLRDNTDSPFPEYFAKALDKVIQEQKEFQKDLLAHLQNLKQDHQQHDEKLDEIISYLQQILSGPDNRKQDRPYIHNLPYPTIGDLLKGRGDELDMLQKQLAKGEKTAITQAQAIHGLGGIGKTRLAVEFGWHQIKKGHTSGVFFVLADSLTSLISNLANLAKPTLLNLPEQNLEDQPALVEIVIKTLSRIKDCLVIFDNVDDSHAIDKLHEILPQLAGCQVLITSRQSNWKGVKRLPIDKLAKNDAIAYLLEKTEDRSESPDDKKLAGKLANKLDGLPIALEQAAAYINYLHIGFQAYLEKFEEARKEVLQWHKDSLQDYPEPVLVAWKTTEEQLGLREKSVLRLASFLAPDSIPTTLFKEKPESISDATELYAKETNEDLEQDSAEQTDIRNVLAKLSGWSMIILTEKSFYVHRLVQDSFRLRIPDTTIKSWTELALAMVRGFVPSDPPPDDIRSWDVWNTISPHVLAITDHGNNVKTPEPTGWLMNSLALHFNAKTSFEVAETLYHKALAINENTVGPDHPNTASCLNNLAQLYKATNRLKEAEPLMQRHLVIFLQFTRRTGHPHPHLENAIKNYTNLLMQMGHSKDEIGARLKRLAPEMFQ